MDAVLFLLPPFVLCVILAGIHCYLGLHVLARGVIFVDLSLAQVAAMGTTVAVLFGFEHHSLPAYLIALICTFSAAGLFALARRYEQKFSQEAMIGVVYALAAGLVVLIVDKIAHGAEHIKEVLVGHVLWASWHDVLYIGIIYSVVAGIHYFFRKPLIKASFAASGRKHMFWDFIFYALFGVVITSSVSVVGVLQVFAYLIVPAMVVSVFYETIRERLLWGWALSFGLSFLGMVVSHIFDLPAGAFIVVCFALVPVILLVIYPRLR